MRVLRASLMCTVLGLWGCGEGVDESGLQAVQRSFALVDATLEPQAAPEELPVPPGTVVKVGRPLTAEEQAALAVPTVDFEVLPSPSQQHGPPSWAANGRRRRGAPHPDASSRGVSEMMKAHPDAGVHLDPAERAKYRALWREGTAEDAAVAEPIQPAHADSTAAQREYELWLQTHPLPSASAQANEKAAIYRRHGR